MELFAAVLDENGIKLSSPNILMWFKHPGTILPFSLDCSNEKQWTEGQLISGRKPV